MTNFDRCACDFGRCACRTDLACQADHHALPPQRHRRNRRGRIIGRRHHSPLYGHHPPKKQRVGKAMPHEARLTWRAPFKALFCSEIVIF